jgi:hypothetical protein
MNDLLIEKEIKIFFHDPQDYIQPPNNYGTLYLLRRDINRCMEEKIIWPGAMAVLAGIDLLGKFYSGNDDSGKVGTRFKAYYNKWIDNQNAGTIYQLRNSLLHSFGLFSKKDGKIYHVSANHDNLVEQYSGTSYKIDLYTLWDEFEKSIESYKSDLMNDNSLKTKFHKMFELYGIIEIGKVTNNEQMNNNFTL